MYVQRPKMWLDDEIINDAQEVLAKQFGDKWKGLQLTNYGTACRFKVTRENNLQILNVGNVHWVATSSDSCGNIMMYDSLFTGTLASSLQNQLASLYKADSKNLQIRVYSESTAARRRKRVRSFYDSFPHRCRIWN